MPTRSSAYALTPRARADLIEIWDYTVATWSLAQAEIYDDLIGDAFENLAADPARGLDVGHLRTGFRRWSVGQHYIFYRETDAGQEIVRILHQRRDFQRHLPKD